MLVSSGREGPGGLHSWTEAPGKGFPLEFPAPSSLYLPAPPQEPRETVSYRCGDRWQQNLSFPLILEGRSLGLFMSFFI